MPDRAHLGGDEPVPVSWPLEKLVRRLCLALTVAKRAIRILGDGGYFDDEIPEDSFGPDKPLAETAMLLHVAAAVKGNVVVQELVEELCRLLSPYARSNRTAYAIALYPTICFQLAMPHILLSQHGLEDPSL